MFTEDERKEVSLIIRQYLEGIDFNHKSDSIDDNELFSATDKEASIKLEPSKEDIAKALGVAVKAIYFEDSSECISYMYEIVELLGGKQAYELCENDCYLAFEEYCK